MIGALQDDEREEGDAVKGLLLRAALNSTALSGDRAVVFEGETDSFGFTRQIRASVGHSLAME